jgi:hypothetical protein
LKIKIHQVAADAFGEVAFLSAVIPFMLLEFFHLVSDWSRNAVIAPEGEIIYGVPQTTQLKRRIKYTTHEG